MNDSLDARIRDIEREIEALSRKLFPKNLRTDRIRALSEEFRSDQKVSDLRFDRIFPRAIQRLSDSHWTPVEVAIRAANLLVDAGVTRVLDVGSGCGKFCLVAALTSRCQFVGIEQRGHLVEVARNAALELGVSNVSFNLGNMADIDWTDFDAFYLFNPFCENDLRSIRINGAAPMKNSRFIRDIETVRTKLKMARIGSKVATYHGFGGDFPAGYRRLRREPYGCSFLDLWEKVEFSPPFAE